MAIDKKKKKQVNSLGIKKNKTKGSVKKVASKKASSKKVSTHKVGVQKATKKKTSGPSAIKKKKGDVKATKKVASKKGATKKAATKKATSSKVTNKKPAAKANGRKSTSHRNVKKAAAQRETGKPGSKKLSGANGKNVTIKQRSKTTALAKIKKALTDVPLANIPWSEFISPVGDRVLVVTDPPATVTAGGLFIPDMARGESNKATVVAVGPGQRSKKGLLTPPDVRVGDRVLIQKYAGNKMNLRGQSVLLVRESEIIGVVDEPF